MKKFFKVFISLTRSFFLLDEPTPSVTELPKPIAGAKSKERMLKTLEFAAMFLPTRGTLYGHLRIAYSRIDGVDQVTFMHAGTRCRYHEKGDEGHLRPGLDFVLKGLSWDLHAFLTAHEVPYATKAAVYKLIRSIQDVYENPSILLDDIKKHAKGSRGKGRVMPS